MSAVSGADPASLSHFFALILFRPIPNEIDWLRGTLIGFLNAEVRKVIIYAGSMRGWSEDIGGPRRELGKKEREKRGGGATQEEIRKV